MLKEGLTHTSMLTVKDSDTALHLGSGDMPVLATPALMALMENAAMLAVAGELEEGQTTVGGHIESSHVKPSKVGERVEATATLVRIEGRKLYYHITARMGDVIIGEGKHLRFIVDRERFLSKL
ncbi:thioesterase family protein [Prevotella sp. KH2C16]|uniref:thioesterase family protein n=1 Tax=Prevotella sp. KH2C16 TaxID=1855325 RepID=UPI0008E26E7D|nr:thioesterase family protein [Prevotella sp. KH2C16]SFG06494.1 Predicted thioesterase [Prevotella sp. KH2C16]